MEKDDSSRNKSQHDENEKQEQMDKFRRKNTGPGKKLTTDDGTKVSNNR